MPVASAPVPDVDTPPASPFLTPADARTWAPIIALILLGAAMAALYWRFSYDDAFITYRYAYNLATGHGFVYNLRERYLGTTTPLYGLLLGLLGRPRPDQIPQISGALSGLSLTLTGLALLQMGRQAGQAWCGFLAGLFYIINPIPTSAFGGEMPFQTMLIAWTFVLYRQDRTYLMAALLAAATLTRPDALVAALTIGAHALSVRRRLLWREMLLFLSILAPFLLLCWSYYGTFLPSTFGAKLAQRQNGIWLSFWNGGWRWTFDTAGYVPDGWGFLLLALIGVLLFVRRRAADGGPGYDVWGLPLAWVLVYAIAYQALHVPFYVWYLVPVAFAGCILAAMGLAGIAGLLAEGLARVCDVRGHPWVTSLPSTLLLVLLIPAVAAQFAYAHTFVQKVQAERPVDLKNLPIPFLRGRLYRDMALWLKAHTPADASIGYLELGYVGFYSQRRMIDPLGLVNRGVAPHVAVGDFAWAYQTYRPDYIIDNPEFDWTFGGVEAAPWFHQEYRPFARVRRAGFQPITIYRRLPLRSH